MTAPFYVRSEMTPLHGVRLSPENVPENLAHAYALVRARIDDDRAYGAAWKLGGTTFATRKAFGVDRPYFGALHEREVLHLPAAAPGLPLFELKAEAEIALQLSPMGQSALAGSGEALAEIPARKLFAAWCWALEFPSSPIENLLECGVCALVADRCAAGALALGEPHPLDDGARPHDELRLLENGRLIGQGGLAALVEPPETCARLFLTEALAQGYYPQPGQWIATGGLTPCVELRDGARIELFCGEACVLALTARRASP